MYSSFYRNLTQLQTKSSFLAAAYIHSVQILSELAEAVLAVQKHNLDLYGLNMWDMTLVWLYRKIPCIGNCISEQVDM